jgi:predicted small integral membrane protein
MDSGFSLGWMAWTWPTAAFFLFIFGAIALMGLLEWRNPGGNPRHGVLGLDTTRGDRLFISLLGSAYIFLGWLTVLPPPLWGPLALALLWSAFVFWKV